MTWDPARLIADDDVSVVVQGPATEKLRSTVSSVRRFLPGSELIVSTWEGADVEGIDADVLVLNVDPGSGLWPDARGKPTSKSVNTNRMLRSTLAGLQKATRTHAIKLRADTPLRSPACLAWFDLDDRPRTAELRVFERRVVMPNVAVRPAETTGGFLFHPSDVVHLGLRSDLLRLWDCPLIDEEDNAFWFRNRPRPSPDYLPTIWTRYFNEQVVWLSCLRRHGMDPGYDHAGHFSPMLACLSEHSIANNFVCAEPWQLGISLPFDEVLLHYSRYDYRWFPDWERAVELICPS